MLPPLRGRLPLPIPFPRWLGQPSAASLPVHRLRLPAGPDGRSGRPGHRRSDALARDLGGFLRALHAVAPPAETPLDGLRRSDTAWRYEQATARLAELTDRPLAGHVQALLDQALEALPPDADAAGAAHRVLVHGDLYSKHLLIREGALAGVIDWGDVHQGDPAQDLAAGWLVLPTAARPAFEAAYGGIDTGTAARARLRAIWDVVITLHFTERSPDEGLRASALACVADAAGWWAQ
ncbi:MAG: phosphotransferase [bacterium]